MDQRRTARVGEALREELSQLVNFEMSDPRLRHITVADVSVTPDGRQARVNVGLYGDAEEQKETMKALTKARNHLRHELASRLQLRHVPELFFLADTGTAATSRVEVLLDRVRKNRRGPQDSTDS